MTLGALDVTQFLAAGMMLLLAGWLLWLGFARRVNRAFALFLVLRALTTISNRLSDPAVDGGYWERVSRYFLLATAPALLAFLVVYAAPRRSTASRAALAGLLFVALAAEAAYAFDHCLDRCRVSPAEQRLGPLALLSFNVPLAMALAGLYLAWEHRRLPVGPQRSASFLVGLAFLLNATLDASVTLGVMVGPHGGPSTTLATYVPSPWNPLYLFFHVLALPLGLAGVWLLGRPDGAGAAEPRARLASQVGAALSVLVGLLLGAAWTPSLTDLVVSVIGLWRILLPAIVVYALLRHRLFDLDVRVRWTISKGTIVFSFLAVFFVAEQIVQNYVSAQFGLLVGIAAAALLIPAQKLLGRVGDRVAGFFLPHARPAAEMERMQRVETYRSHALDAWAEGTLDRAGRARLDVLRGRLGLSLEECARIEHDAAFGVA